MVLFLCKDVARVKPLPYNCHINDTQITTAMNSSEKLTEGKELANIKRNVPAAKAAPAPPSPCAAHAIESNKMQQRKQLRKQHNSQRISWPFETFTTTKVLQKGKTLQGQDLELVIIDTHSRAGIGAVISTHCEIWLDGCGYHYLHPSTTLHEIEAAWQAAQQEDSLIMGAAY